MNCYTFQWDFFDLYHDHMKISDKLIENLNQSGSNSNISFSKDSKAENFSLLLDELVPLLFFRIVSDLILYPLD